VPMSLVVVAVILMTSLNEKGTGTLSMIGIVQAQEDQGTWFLFKFFPLGFIACVVFIIGMVAQTNRAGFAVAAERPLDAGSQNKYGGLRRLLLIFAEYAAMIAACSVAVTLWLGGWLRPFGNRLSASSWENIFSLFPGFTFLLLTAIAFVVTVRGGSPSRPRRMQLAVVAALLGLIAALLFMIAVAGRSSDRHILASLRENVNYVYWFAVKVAILLLMLLYFRSAGSRDRFGRYLFDRYRFDSSTRLAWKILVPVSLAVLALTAIVGLKHETWDQAKQLLRIRS
jgi:NADH-quinone oxidoreductase subunit H